MSANLTDEEVWQLAVDGDPAARARIAELANRYSRLTLQRRGVRPPDLDDLAQEAVLGVERCRASGRTVRIFQRFVYFRSLSILKTYRARQRLRSHDEIDSAYSSPDHVEPGEAAAALELLQAVARCRDALPDSLRMAVDLRHTEDRTLPEIADRLSLSLGGVRERLRRAWHLVHACLRSRGFSLEDDPS